MPSGILIHPAVEATIDISRKLGETPLPFGGGKLGLNVTQRGQGRGLPATCMQSFILIRPAVWPQYTNVTDRSDRQDRKDDGPVA